MADGTHQSLEWFAANHGLQTNQHGRVFESRKAMDLTEKSELRLLFLMRCWGPPKTWTRKSSGALCHGSMVGDSWR